MQSSNQGEERVSPDAGARMYRCNSASRVPSLIGCVATTPTSPGSQDQDATSKPRQSDAGPIVRHTPDKPTTTFSTPPEPNQSRKREKADSGADKRTSFFLSIFLIDACSWLSTCRDVSSPAHRCQASAQSEPAASIRKETCERGSATRPTYVRVPQSSNQATNNNGCLRTAAPCDGVNRRDVGVLVQHSRAAMPHS